MAGFNSTAGSHPVHVFGVVSERKGACVVRRVGGKGLLQSVLFSLPRQPSCDAVSKGGEEMRSIQTLFCWDPMADHRDRPPPRTTQCPFFLSFLGVFFSASVAKTDSFPAIPEKKRVGPSVFP